MVYKYMLFLILITLTSCGSSGSKNNKSHIDKSKNNNNPSLQNDAITERRIIRDAKENGFKSNKKADQSKIQYIKNPQLKSTRYHVEIDLEEIRSANNYVTITNSRPLHMTIVSFNNGLPAKTRQVCKSAIDKFVRSKGNVLSYDISEKWGPSSNKVKGDLELLGLYIRNELVKKGLLNKNTGNPKSDQRILHIQIR